LESIFYLLYNADILIVPSTTVATCANNATILIAHNNHIEASLSLQESLFYIQKWLKEWRIRINGAKSVQATFTIRPPVTLNILRIPQDTKYLGLHLDRRLKWWKYIFIKRKQLGIVQYDTFFLCLITVTSAVFEHFVINPQTLERSTVVILSPCLINTDLFLIGMRLILPRVSRGRSASKVRGRESLDFSLLNINLFSSLVQYKDSELERRTGYSSCFAWWINKARDI